MISTSEISNGANLEIDGQLFTVVWFQHHKPGKGGAMVRLKLKNLRTGAIIERTVRSGEKFKEVNLDRKKMQFLYKEGESYHFMDTQTYEQVSFDADHLGDGIRFLQDNMEADVLYYGDEVMGVSLPNTVELKVNYTEKGLKGDTVSSTLKPATVETGAVVQVPLFVEIGDTIKIDTRTGEYLGRV
ncbi:MAG: elongation factor P [Elusimicrobiota bacterium]